MPIQSIIRKAITDHLVNHVNVGNDKRCRIDILCEQAEQEILEWINSEKSILNWIKEYINSKIEYANDCSKHYPIIDYGSDSRMSDEQISGYYHGMSSWLHVILYQIRYIEEELKTKPQTP